MASSSARFMCLASFSRRSQKASSTMAPLASRITPMASELASTKTVNSLPSTHQSPHTGSSRVTLVTVSVNMLLRKASRTSSFLHVNPKCSKYFWPSRKTILSLTKTSSMLPFGYSRPALWPHSWLPSWC